MAKLVITDDTDQGSDAVGQHDIERQVETQSNRDSQAGLEKAEDRAQATPFGEPSFPEAVQIVLSVIGGKVRDIKSFNWSVPLERYVGLNIPGLS